MKSLNFHGRRFDSLEAFQAWTDAKLDAQAEKRKCPVTGKTVADTWREEQPLLRPVPATLPEPFDLIKECDVYKDCTISFEGRNYAVPFRYVRQRVEVRGCSHVVQIVDRKTGEIVQEYPRNTEETLLIDPSCYEGESTGEVRRPVPLGRMSKALQDIAETPAPLRSIEIYAQLAEVSR